MGNSHRLWVRGFAWRSIGLLLAVSAVALLATPGRAEECVLTNADIIKMADAGLPEAVILSSIRSCRGQFDLTPDGLVDLKAHKVSDGVIAAMQQPAVAEPAKAASGGEIAPVEELGFYIALKQGEMIKMKSSTTTVKGSGGRVAADAFVPFAAFARRKHKTTIPGAHATFRLKPDDIAYFVYYTSPGMPIDIQTLRLVRAEVVEDKELRQLSATVTAVTGGQKQEEAGIPWTIKTTKVPGLYQIMLESPPQPGEYAVIFGQFGQERTYGIRDVWDFGVD